jgi:hypothetical protein
MWNLSVLSGIAHKRLELRTVKSILNFVGTKSGPVVLTTRAVI